MAKKIAGLLVMLAVLAAVAVVSFASVESSIPLPGSCGYCEGGCVAVDLPGGDYITCRSATRWSVADFLVNGPEESEYGLFEPGVKITVKDPPTIGTRLGVFPVGTRLSVEGVCRWPNGLCGQ